MILKLYEDASTLLEDQLFESQVLWVGAYKNRIDQPEEMEWSKHPIKLLGNSIPNNSNWDKKSKGITKKIHIWK